MKQYEGKLVGILGTIIIHLIAALIFMSVKLSSLYHEKSSEFMVEFVENRDFAKEEIVEVPLTLEELFENDDRFIDIVRNISNEDVADIDPSEYQDRVKEELIASGLLGEDNFIDDQKKMIEEMDKGDTAIESDKDNIDTTDQKLTANEMAAMYQGPTRIFYELPNRHHLKMPIPIYKCENSGVIVIDIFVDQRGRITEYSLNNPGNTIIDECLLEAAVSSVKRTRFNPDTNAPEKQQGSITFQFIAQ